MPDKPVNKLEECRLFQRDFFAVCEEVFHKPEVMRGHLEIG
jgi:hypothetical protein